MSRVYIPQVPMRWDEERTEMKMAFDLGPAAAFGEIYPILQSNENPLFVARMIPDIRKRLQDFGHNDYFLAIGDPVLIAICSGILLRRNASIKMLRWDRRLKIYNELEVKP